MKIAAAALTAALVALATRLGVDAANTCMASCQSEVMTHQVTDCAVWRERLPRPDLYSLCQDGYDLGISAGCDGYCTKNVDEGRLASLRLDACTFLRGTPPMDRMRACQSGFSSAVKRAKDSKVCKEHAEAAVETAPETAAAITATTTTTTANSVESEQAAPKKIVSIKKNPEARNILELAREEAQAAFQTDTTHASEL